MNEPTTTTIGSKLSYNGTIPSKQFSHDILLVGERCWVQPLASALLMVQFDRYGHPSSTFDCDFHSMSSDNIHPKVTHRHRFVSSSCSSCSLLHSQTTENDNAAIGVLRKHVPMVPPRKRYIHMIESLSIKPFWKYRMDHIVLVIPPISDRQTLMLLPSENEQGSYQHHPHYEEEIENVLNSLHDDYILFQRVTVIRVRDDFDRVGEISRNRRYMMISRKRTMEDLTQNPTLSSTASSCTKARWNSLVQFSVHGDQPSSWRTVARMLLQRTALGTRQGTCHLPMTSPFIWKPSHHPDVPVKNEKQIQKDTDLLKKRTKTALDPNLH
jgi:hypothetical protein